MAGRVARRRANEKSLLFCAGMQDLAVRVHSPPQVHLFAADPDEHLVQVPSRHCHENRSEVTTARMTGSFRPQRSQSAMLALPRP
jgi:hypothetical protein